MSNALPVFYLARHAETTWSLTGQHTGLTDLPLTERGEQNARALGERLIKLNFPRVLTSPLQRVARTCDLAGFGRVAEIDRDLLEWNYGEYEGRRSTDRVLAARWLGLKAAAARYLLVNTASLSALGYEHSLGQPVIRLWNDTRHVNPSLDPL